MKIEETTATMERETLGKLYEQTGGPEWRHSENWLSDRPLGEWQGVVTDRRTGRVIALDLSHNNLRGTLPEEWRQLDGLERVELEGKELTGEIPADLIAGRSTRIVMLQDNQLTGRIPEATGRTPDLRELSLCNNRISGPIPGWIVECPNLFGLWLSGCRLSGEIPAGLGAHGKLIALDLAHNELTGRIPRGLGGENLLELYLEGNPLQGGIPTELWEIPNHDLPEVAGTLGREITGHVTSRDRQRCELVLETCPEWPSRKLTMRARRRGLMENLRQNQLIWALYTDLEGELWLENLADRSEPREEER